MAENGDPFRTSSLQNPVFSPILELEECTDPKCNVVMSYTVDTDGSITASSARPRPEVAPLSNRSTTSSPRSDSTLEDFDQGEPVTHPSSDSTPSPCRDVDKYGNQIDLPSHDNTSKKGSSHHPSSQTSTSAEDTTAFRHPDKPPRGHSDSIVAQRVAQYSSLSDSSQTAQEPHHFSHHSAHHDQWRPNFQEVDVLHGSQPYEDEYYNKLSQGSQYYQFYMTESSPLTQGSLKLSLEGSYPENSYTESSYWSQPLSSSGAEPDNGGRLSDEGMSTTSSMEELTLINREASSHLFPNKATAKIVKPTVVKDGVRTTGHNHMVEVQSTVTPSWHSGNHGNTIVQPMHSNDHSLSQPWAGGVSYDYYGYTLSQPSMGYTNPQVGLSGIRGRYNQRGVKICDIKALNDAASSGDQLLIRRLLSGNHNHLSPVIKDDNNSTPIHKAARHGHLPCLRYLVKVAPPGAVHTTDDECNTPTLLALQNGHLECVKWLVEEAGVPLIVSNSGGETLLHYAAFHGQVKILEWLLEKIRAVDENDIDDIVDDSGVTPGHFAAYYGHLECLQMLWSQGVHLMTKDKCNHTPSDWARSAKQTLCSNYLATVETCWNLMEEVSELQQQVFDLQVRNQQQAEDLRCMESSHSKEMERLKVDHSKVHRSKPLRKLRGHEAYRIQITSKPMERHSLEDIEKQKERAKEEMRKRKSLLRKKLLETKDQKGPEDVLAVMRTMSPLSPMLRKELSEQKVSPMATPSGQKLQTSEKTRSAPAQREKVHVRRHSSEHSPLKEHNGGRGGTGGGKGRAAAGEGRAEHDRPGVVRKDSGKNVTFADEVAAAARQQNLHRRMGSVEVDIDAAINKNTSSQDRQPVQPPSSSSRGYREVNIDRAVDMLYTYEVNIDEAIQKRGPRTHKGIMKHIPSVK